MGINMTINSFREIVRIKKVCKTVFNLELNNLVYGRTKNV